MGGSRALDNVRISLLSGKGTKS